MLPVPTLAQLAPFVAERLVSRVEQGPLAIFNYTENCTYAGAWNDVTRAARGLILDTTTGACVARAFDKFFNYGESHGEGVPEGPPDVVTVKHDGSLGISYRLDGRLRWSTRGSFYSPQAAVAERIWARKYPGVEIPDDLTVLVEIISEGTRNIVRYSFEDLVVIGIRNRHSGEDLPYEAVCRWAAAWGMPVTERVEGGFEELVARSRTMDHSEEGFVLRWGDVRVKVKSVAYLRVARLIQGLTDRAIADLWYARRFDLLAPLPEEHRDFATAAIADLDAALEGVTRDFSALWQEVSQIADRKRLVETVGTAHPLFPAIMQQYTGRTPDLRADVYRQRFAARPRPLE